MKIHAIYGTTYKDLEKENIRLKNQLKYLRSNEYLNQVIWEINFCEETIKVLQQKIDKAIEKLKEIKTDLDFEPWSIYQVKGKILFDLLKILGDKEKL